jgi:toxin-antitoxin system PIN domain toxin
MSSAFPDVNVWLALTYEGHEGHKRAMRWLRETESDKVIFCRMSQIGLLRLLSTEVVMRQDRMSQVEAWAAYDTWYKKDDRIHFVNEPGLLDAVFRGLARSVRPVTPGDWADAYFTAFAQLIGSVIVTFDRRLAERAKPGSLLLS